MEDEQQTRDCFRVIIGNFFVVDVCVEEADAGADDVFNFINFKGFVEKGLNELLRFL